MSIQFGRWSFGTQPASRDRLQQMEAFLICYGPDHGASYSTAGIDMFYRAFHTTEESHKESQPYVSRSGTAFTWDGRLDNRAELVRELQPAVTIENPDVEIVAAAYDRWRNQAFARLIGDWAVCVWANDRHTLILAKDAVGARHLYYSLSAKEVVWSTVLDPLVLSAGFVPPVSEEYVAGCLSSFPATHVTPYVGIHSVPPSCLATIRRGRQTITRYWDFDSSNEIRYSRDSEYEEHFRHVFGESVRRRLRSNTPVLAELSGGMDSSSIVCMADALLHNGRAETARLDTVSYYNNCEPNWDERPYFTAVESWRHQTGTHIDVERQASFAFAYDPGCFVPTPMSRVAKTESADRFAACLLSRGARVVLSGTGGDEVLGGVPTPIPELADLARNALVRVFLRQLVAWSLVKRQPLWHLTAETLCAFLPLCRENRTTHNTPVTWLEPGFAKRHRKTLRGSRSRLAVFGPLPSFQENLATLDQLRRQLSCSTLSPNPPYERRYPFLDRDLLQFLYSIPREQLVRPGLRRSLMRRALAGILPAAILDRKRKAFVARSPFLEISEAWSQIQGVTNNLVIASLGYVDAKRFVQILEDLHTRKERHVVPVMRALKLEFWLRHLAHFRTKSLLETSTLSSGPNERNPGVPLNLSF
jgi:asparagine synthase (glutamine-hydrolysing)